MPLLVSLLYDITKNYSIIWPACAVSMAFTLVASPGMHEAVPE
ncbi:MAG: hypothetical protein ACLVD8_27460 [Enterocloster sp.]